MMIEHVLRQRLEYIKTSTPLIEVESYISQSLEGDWGLIVTIDGRRMVKQYWFFESGCSYQRPEAVDQYNIYVDAGFSVTVACPESCVRELKAMVQRHGRAGINVVSFKSLGIQVSSIPPSPFPMVGE